MEFASSEKAWNAFFSIQVGDSEIRMWLFLTEIIDGFPTITQAPVACQLP
jgi:hypothetical protein